MKRQGSESKTVITKLGLRQDCSLLPGLCNIHIDEVIREWKEKINFYTYDLNCRKAVVTLVNADDQILLANSEEALQMAVFNLQNTMNHFILEISIPKTKFMAFQGKEFIRSKIVINDEIIDQVNIFNFLGYSISLNRELDIDKRVE